MVFMFGFVTVWPRYVTALVLDFGSFNCAFDFSGEVLKVAHLARGIGAVYSCVP